MTLQQASRPLFGSCSSGPEFAALAVPALRGIVAALDEVFTSFDPEPEDGSAAPQALATVRTYLGACRSQADGAGLFLLGRVAGRSIGFVERLCAGKSAWGLVEKLALEELVSVIDMIVDVVELVGVDSGCRQEERISFRILATVAPQVLADVDGLDFRDIRFHQASSSHRAERAG